MAGGVGERVRGLGVVGVEGALDGGAVVCDGVVWIGGVVAAGVEVEEVAAHVCAGGRWWRGVDSKSSCLVEICGLVGRDRFFDTSGLW